MPARLKAGAVCYIALLLGPAAADSGRLPPEVPPELCVWGWMEREFEPEGYRRFLDMIARESGFNLIAATLRASKREVTAPETRAQIGRAVAYAHRLGLRMAFDLDARLARGEFLKRFPEQQQWMLRVRCYTAGRGAVRVEVKPAHLEDHMTWPDGRYEPLGGRLMGVFLSDAAGSLVEMRAGWRVVEESAQRVVIEAEPGLPGSEIIVAAAFRHRTPDVFAPSLDRFQEEIYESYREIRLDGVLKDEWGFPPVYNQGPREGDFWYSEPLEAAWRRAGGQDLVRDAVLMFTGLGGGHQRRIAAVNRYLRLILTRNAEIERGFHESIKRIFGRTALTATHATWGLMPFGDAFKNGIDWWWAPRDYGQTDEHWPLPVRTSLAKRMGGAVWYNQFYDAEVAPYYREIWRNARAGGRIHLHPLWPSTLDDSPYLRLLRSPLMKAERRIRLLNFIVREPLDCPVGVVFGHAAAVNWVGPHFGDLGVDFAESLWSNGVPADVIPSTEIESGALRIGEDGWVRYGVQNYRALVFVNSEYEPARTFEFLRQAARSKTMVFIRGRSELTFEGRRRPSEETLVPGAGLDPTPSRVGQFLNNFSSSRPSPSAPARLTDGTCVLARGEKDPSGDVLEESFACGATKVRVQATGVFAIRLTRKGEVDALAGSDLRLVEAGRFHLALPSPMDLALWHDAGGKWRGVVQGAARLPDNLAAITQDWTRIQMPPNGN